MPGPDDSPPIAKRWMVSGTDRLHTRRIGDPDAPVRVIVVHGAGGNSAALAPFAAHVAALGAIVTVVDLPGYGLTEVADAGSIRYAQWRRAVVDLVEHDRDARPLVLIGASMGGMLAYDAAALTGAASAIIVTCLLDPRDARVRDVLPRSRWMARAAGPALRVLAGPLARVRVPIRWIADMRAIANDPRLVDLVVSDPRGGGGRVPLGWMRSYLESAPVVEPESFTVPTVLAQPADDRWTPLDVSLPFFERLAGPRELVLLDGCGHFPVEQPGFDRLIDVVRDQLARVRG